MKYTLELKTEKENRAIIGISCYICGGFIPIDFIESNPNRLCEECRKRLKEILYPTEDTRGEE